MRVLWDLEGLVEEAEFILRNSISSPWVRASVLRAKLTAKVKDNKERWSKRLAKLKPRGKACYEWTHEDCGLRV